MSGESNLKPAWQPGSSGNPEGGRKHKGLSKKLRELTREEFKEIAELIVKGKVSKLQAIIDDAKKEGKGRHSVLKTWVAAIAVKAIMKGDMHSLDLLMNRLIGKVPNDLKISNPDGTLRPVVHLGLPSNGRDEDDLGPDEPDQA